jgi:hypothetical protein
VVLTLTLAQQHEHVKVHLVSLSSLCISECGARPAVAQIYVRNVGKALGHPVLGETLLEEANVEETFLPSDNALLHGTPPWLAEMPQISNASCLGSLHLRSACLLQVHQISSLAVSQPVFDPAVSSKLHPEVSVQWF